MNVVYVLGAAVRCARVRFCASLAASFGTAAHAIRVCVRYRSLGTQRAPPAYASPPESERKAPARGVPQQRVGALFDACLEAHTVVSCVYTCFSFRLNEFLIHTFLGAHCSTLSMWLCSILFRFGDHPLGHALTSALTLHARDQVQVTCYSTAPHDLSPWRRKIEASAERVVQESTLTFSATFTKKSTTALEFNPKGLPTVASSVLHLPYNSYWYFKEVR